jgi:hypothetical protein
MSDYGYGFITGARVATLPWILWLLYTSMPEIPETTYGPTPRVAIPGNYYHSVETTTTKTRKRKPSKSKKR